METTGVFVIVGVAVGVSVVGGAIVVAGLTGAIVCTVRRGRIVELPLLLFLHLEKVNVAILALG